MSQILGKARSLLQRFYQPTYMVKDSLKLGEMPTTRDGYNIALATAVAAIIETFLISLIGMVDMIMVSELGEASIAAVGIVNQPRYLAQTLIFALNIAVTSICARRKGENDRIGANDCLKQGLVLSLGLSVVITVALMPLSRTLISFMGAKADTIDLATNYFQILLLGLPLANLSHTISSAQRGIGQTKASMVINMAANIVNASLDFLLITGRFGFPRLGVPGGAMSTVIGWGVGLVLAIMSVWSINGFLSIRTKEGTWKPEKKTIKPMAKIISGSFFEQVFMRLGFISYTKVVAGLGTVMYAAHEILINLMSLSFSFGEGFGISASSLVGQNLGAKRSDLAIVYGKICQRMSLISSGALFLIFSLFGKQMVGFFTDDPSIIKVSSVILYMIGFILFAQSSQMVFMGALRGAGDTKYTAIISMVSIMLIRPAVGYFCAYTLNWGLPGAWIGLIIDQVLRLWLTYRRFSSGKWKEIQL